MLYVRERIPGNVFERGRERERETDRQRQGHKENMKNLTTFHTKKNTFRDIQKHIHPQARKMHSKTSIHLLIAILAKLCLYFPSSRSSFFMSFADSSYFLMPSLREQSVIRIGRRGALFSVDPILFMALMSSCVIQRQDLD